MPEMPDMDSVLTAKDPEAWMREQSARVLRDAGWHTEVIDRLAPEVLERTATTVLLAKSGFHDPH